ncbi:Creatinase aminopeptidase [Zychaea mexicana]|uniref:Creatinase aminopeptidase n=1 Tax=Zychaea mexicana TaxID=64656 RepID=UPI0022FF3422|nr:Creatinase aminopeptidase [Zychaea mexicana]KAI9497106.1 Creatinase aminopeptidase [Zychaea mexicana]
MSFKIEQDNLTYNTARPCLSLKKKIMRRSAGLLNSLKRTFSTHVSDNRLDALRQAMTSSTEKIDAFVIPSEDAHQSEYTAECDNRRAWISGFTGSAGCAVVSQDCAALFTDGRYFLQASQELSSDWQLMKQGMPKVPTWQEYLVKNLPKGSRIGIDPALMTIDNATALEKELASVGSQLVPVQENPVDRVRKDRPKRPTHPIYRHNLKYAGKNRESKLHDLRVTLTQRGYDGTVVSALDEIAWLLNLRGSDIHCCPIFFAYCVVSREDTVLYVANADERMSSELRAELDAHVQIKPYDSIWDDLKHQNASNRRFMIDPTLTNLSIVQALGGQDKVGLEPSPVALTKAIKNEAELNGMREAHKRDGVAVSKHFAWLSDQLRNKRERLYEADAVQHLEDMRRQHDTYVGISFDTIAATGPNGAIIHYNPSPTHSAIIDPQQMYLCDSGAHYIDGTTDITRTYLFDGKPTDFQKRAFTRVMQSHIAVDTATFPPGVTGYQLDSIARQPLWKDGLDYRHGTGHGVGAYLNVHEGPHGIGSRQAYSKVPFKQGMVVTNEPGYYQDGEFGIRLENVLIVNESKTAPYHFGGHNYLGFEHVTFVPFGRRLFDTSLLNEADRTWINSYHQECRRVLEPQLVNDSRTLKWIEEETEPI